MGGVRLALGSGNLIPATQEDGRYAPFREGDLPVAASHPIPMGPRRRRDPRVPGPESALISAALARHARLISRQELFLEPALPTGFPDAVIVVLGRNRLIASIARLRLTDLHLRLVQHVFGRGRMALQEISGDLLWSRRQVDAVAQDLVAAEIALLDQGEIEIRPLREVFVARRIIAIEAKIRDWRRAIEQARANTWFASHSFILLPGRRFTAHVAEGAVEAGVGVLTFDGTATAIQIQAEEHPLPTSYGSWLFNEWALRRAQHRAENA